MPSGYVATCRRDGSSWRVEIPELQASARAGRLSQVEEAARALLVTFTHGNPDGAGVIVELVVEDEVRALLDAAEALRGDDDAGSTGAVALRGDVARRLAAAGFTVRDVASLLGLPYARAQVLVGDAEEATETVAPSEPDATVASSEPDDEVHDSYRHEAFLYRSESEFLAGTVSFVRRGVALGQPVMVAVIAPRLRLLREALGGDSERVLFVDMAELGHNPARIIPGWLAFVERNGRRGLPVRGIGEPIWAGRRPAEVAECQLHEALLNLAIDPDTPLWLRCPYHVDALGTSVVDQAMHTHPTIVETGSFRGSTTYGGLHHVETIFRQPLPEPLGDAPAIGFDGASLPDIRRLVSFSARRAGVGHARARDLALAVTELATNSVRHGGGRGSLRMWQDDDTFACEVRDGGRIDNVLVGRLPPPLDAQGGRGVWLAHQLADLVQIRSSASGTTTRVLTWR